MTNMPDPSLVARMAEAAAWCGERTSELNDEIVGFPVPLRELPFRKYGAICQQALNYARLLGAQELIPTLGATDLGGEAGIADALRQVRLLADWLDATVNHTRGESVGRPTEPADVAHSDDFRSVRWYGTNYLFTPTQAACVRVLWEAWERGTPVVGQESILETAGSTCCRLRDVFDKAKHPAWDKMIVSPRKGSFSLAEPS
jgi:hypothetical protein